MRNMRVLGFGLAMLAGGVGVVQAQDVDGLNVQQLFGQLDTNDDKVVDSKEVPESGRPAFEQLLKLGDLNKNGKLELEEYRALAVILREDAGPGASGANTPRQIMAMDKDDDGKVSKEEYQGPAAALRPARRRQGRLPHEEGSDRGPRQGQGGERPRRDDRDGSWAWRPPGSRNWTPTRTARSARRSTRAPRSASTGSTPIKTASSRRQEATPSGEAVDTPPAGPRRRPGIGTGLGGRRIRGDGQGRRRQGQQGGVPGPGAPVRPARRRQGWLRDEGGDRGDGGARPGARPRSGSRRWTRTTTARSARTSTRARPPASTGSTPTRTDS